MIYISATETKIIEFNKHIDAWNHYESQEEYPKGVFRLKKINPKRVKAIGINVSGSDFNGEKNKLMENIEKYLDRKYNGTK